MELDLGPRDEFYKRYGPWAVIAGGSEGVGAAFARKIAGLRRSTCCPIGPGIPPRSVDGA